MFSGTKVTYAIIFSCMFHICFGFLESGFIVCWKRKKTLWFAWIMWLSLCVCVCIYIYIIQLVLPCFVQGFRCRVLPSGWTCLQNYFSLGKVHAEMNKPTVGKVQNVCYCVCVCVCCMFSWVQLLLLLISKTETITFTVLAFIFTVTHSHCICIWWYNTTLCITMLHLSLQLHICTAHA